jgi:hypothetical protein
MWWNDSGQALFLIAGTIVGVLIAFWGTKRERRIMNYLNARNKERGTSQ